MGQKSREKKLRRANPQPDGQKTPPPNVPGQRQYRFYDENDKVHWVNEADLTTDDIKALAREYWQYFLYLPPDAQELVCAAIDGKINEAKSRLEQGKILHDMQKASGLHEGPAVSEGGIVMPGRSDTNPAGNIIDDPLSF